MNDRNETVNDQNPASRTVPEAVLLPCLRSSAGKALGLTGKFLRERFAHREGRVTDRLGVKGSGSSSKDFGLPWRRLAIA
jgi:hypothetical protein